MRYLLLGKCLKALRCVRSIFPYLLSLGAASIFFFLYFRILSIPLLVGVGLACEILLLAFFEAKSNPNFFGILSASLLEKERGTSSAVSMRERFFCFLPMFLFHLSGFFLALFVGDLVRLALAVFELAVTILFIKAVIQHLSSQVKFSLQQSIQDILIFVGYFSFSSLFAFRIFLNTKLWVLAIIAFLVVFLISALSFPRIIKDAKKRNIWLGVSMVLLLEVFWAVNYLPFSFTLGGLILIMSYYFLLLQIERIYTANIAPRVFGRYFLLGIVLLTISFLTSRWV